MEKFKTVNQIREALKEEGYKLEYSNNDGTYTYWDYDGRVAIVDMKNKTIDYKGMM
jgi:hypothetical protein